MRVTWITHLAMCDVCEQYGMSRPVSGGWLETMKDSISCNNEVELSVICIEKGKKTTTKSFRKNNTNYYLIETSEKAYYGNFSKVFKEEINRVLQSTFPDVVHLHGTEFGLWNALDKHWEKKVPVCVSIQGLISVISERYYWAGMNRKSMLWLEKWPIVLQHLKAKKRGKLEENIIQRFLYYLGRTDWDFAHISALNPNARYYHGNEIVRAEFNESNLWNYEKIEEYSIFFAGGYNVPLKGLHRMLEVFPQILRDYPTAHLYVPGMDLRKNQVLKCQVGYFRYLKRKIKELGLEENITFLGKLNASEMAEKFSKSHCYVMGSSIENSPNTLMEAMTVGTPCVVSVVGGVQNFVEDHHSALLYRFEEKEMLVHMIKQVFESKKLAEKLSKNAKSDIAKQKMKGKELSKIYKEIIDDFNMKDESTIHK